MSESEGEIIEPQPQKAIPLPQISSLNNVDRRSRRENQIARSPRGSATDRDRSRSPFRHARPPPRRENPRRDDTYFPRRHDSDTRRHRVHYHDDRSYSVENRRRVSYDDITNDVHHEDRDYRDRSYDQPNRSRSRSPERAPRRIDRHDRPNRYDRNGGRDARDRRNRDGRARENGPAKNSGSDERKASRGGVQGVQGYMRQEAGEGKLGGDDASKTGEQRIEDGLLPIGRMRVDDPTEDASMEVELVDEAVEIEERRKKREAIKAKYRNHGISQLGESAPGTPQIGTPSGQDKYASPIPNSPFQESFTLRNDELANDVQQNCNIDEPGASAADYDPRIDMQEDQRRNYEHNHTEGKSAPDYNETKPSSQMGNLSEAKEGKMSPDHAREFDMFAEDDDDDDMFAVETTSKPSLKPEIVPEVFDSSLQANFDDPEGYYRFMLNEVLDHRYRVEANLGKGMYSGVVRALDLASNEKIAIKIIRNKNTMRPAGLREIEFFQKLQESDPEDRGHIVRLKRHFEHRGHLCMVFENLKDNLREVVKQNGRNTGLHLSAVRSYARQMFIGLKLLKRCNIVHADLKPDNILASQNFQTIKLCDLGTAFDASDTDNSEQPARYLVSRYYRAPEIILGMRPGPDFAIDMWSIGCTLYEIATGRILFTGRDSNQMLKSIMEVRGKITSKFLKRCAYASEHFSDKANFWSKEKDVVTGKELLREMSVITVKDLKSRLLEHFRKGARNNAELNELLKEVILFADLLDKCLHLNPEKRITPQEALRHGFITRHT